MKIMHLSDIHLGKSVGEISMIPDQRYILNEIVKMLQEEKADVLLIAGDVYDRNVPSEQAVELFDEFLYTLSELNLPTIIISGNHDSDERLSFGSRLFSSNNIYITGKYQGEVPCITLQDEFGPVNFYSLPFVKASLVEHFHHDEGDNCSNYEAAVETAIKHTKINTEERNVILSHQFVTGAVRPMGEEIAQDGISEGEEPILSGSEISALNVGTLERIRSFVYDAFDYAALGHIHSPQQVGRESIRYAGSPLKYSLKEVNNTKTVPIVTLCEKGNVNIELHELKPLHEMRHIKGRLKDLTASENVTDSEDYIYCTLTDENQIQDAMAILQSYYPNTMRIDYDNSHTRALGKGGLEEEITERSFGEIMKDFYSKMRGGEPGCEELEILEDAAKEAGII